MDPAANRPVRNRAVPRWTPYIIALFILILIVSMVGIFYGIRAARERLQPTQPTGISGTDGTLP